MSDPVLSAGDAEISQIVPAFEGISVWWRKETAGETVQCGQWVHSLWNQAACREF